ncbi:NrfD/PsrC family molybdoenzyme membrane anchor subunit [Brachybacterium huguangmaarense]
MTSSDLDAYRPPQGERRRRRDRRAGTFRRTGGADGSRETPMVDDVQFESYYGRPIVKAPPWEAPIGLYLFVGGLAGASGLIQAGAAATDRSVLRRAARLTALGAVSAGLPALVVDLGRPERFLHMLRTFKPTSPMSMGTWLLSAFGSAAGLAAAVEVDRMTGERVPLGVLRPLLHAAEVPASAATAVLGAPLATYTAVLLGDTSVPTWSGSRPGLAYVFASSATIAAAGASMVAAPTSETGPVRALAVAGVVGDIAAMEYTKRSMHPLEAEPLEEGAPGRKLKLAEGLAIAGGIGALFAGRSRAVAVASGLALMGASALTRFSVLEAGRESVKDPRRVVEPQKARLAARRARGITDDSITTAG